MLVHLQKISVIVVSIVAGYLHVKEIFSYFGPSFPYVVLHVKIGMNVSFTYLM